MNIKKILVSATAFLMALSMVVSAEPIDRTKYYAYTNDLVSFISKYYYFDKNENELKDVALKTALENPEGGLEAVVNSIMGSLDENSSYFSKDEYELFMKNIVNGSFVGIGVRIIESNGKIYIVEAIKNSPAYYAGFKSGDIIISVDGIDVKNKSLDEIQGMIMGTEGTYTQVGVLRNGEKLSFNVARGTVDDSGVEYKIEDGIGYIYLPQFTSAIINDIKDALYEFDQNEIKKVIIDLRGNSGGEVNTAIELCSLFVKKGVVARIEYKNSKNNELAFSDLENLKYNLAVLIDGGSASASEIFASAVADTNSGVLIGEKSYGKGTVQIIRPIVTGGAIRLTIAQYKTAGGRSMHKIGQEPDIYVVNKEKPVDTSYFKEIDFSKVYKDGDTGEGVLAIEQRLALLGYFDGEADEIYDYKTCEAVQLYQIYNNIEASGNFDINTAINISSIDFDNLKITEDTQLQTAKDVLNGKLGE